LDGSWGLLSRYWQLIRLDKKHCQTLAVRFWQSFRLGLQGNMVIPFLFGSPESALAQNAYN
jgi:hypothetical protein